MIELTYKDYISNEEIKVGDIFHDRYEIISEPKVTKNGYEWKIRHKKWGLRYTGYGVELRMIRPDPSVYLAMDELEQRDIVSDYQRYFIPMQLHPYIEAFYDVRHIGGSTALIEEEAFGYGYDGKMEDFSILGMKGTEAEWYAKENGFTFYEVINFGF